MRGEISIQTFIGIILALFVMFLLPMVMVAQQNDQVVQMTLQDEANDFIYDVSVKKELTAGDYDKFVASVASTGNAYDIEVQIDKLDENVGKKTIQVANTKIGENGSISYYSEQVNDELSDGDGVFELNQGDRISVKIVNSSPTLFENMINSIFKVGGNDTYLILVEASGTV